MSQVPLYREPGIQTPETASPGLPIRIRPKTGVPFLTVEPGLHQQGFVVWPRVGTHPDPIVSEGGCPPQNEYDWGRSETPSTRADTHPYLVVAGGGSSAALIRPENRKEKRGKLKIRSGLKIEAVWQLKRRTVEI